MSEAEMSGAMGFAGMLSLPALLGKERQEFTKRDLMELVSRRGIPMVSFRFVGGDGRLKTLNFVLSGREHLDRLLSAGERTDGSNLFPGFLDPGQSDVYVVPRYRTAFLDPFAAVPTLNVLCSFFTGQGDPLPCSPEHIVATASRNLTVRTGYTFETLAELEYYVLGDARSLYSGVAQRGYGESAPFASWEHLRVRGMALLAQMGYRIKYGHSEVGVMTAHGQPTEQHEIEFNLMSPEESADAVVLARWVLRMLGQELGARVTFAPKLAYGHAGSGLHVHTRLVREGRNVLGAGGRLSEAALRVVAGYLDCGGALTAFGNTVPISYLRLVPHQEAPVYVCWGEQNRSALVRVPLSWSGVKDMARQANPGDAGASVGEMENLTLEFRSADGSADAHLLHAALAVAARHGLEMAEALAVAARLRVDVNVFRPEAKGVRDRLPVLPSACEESADALLGKRAVFEQDGVFPRSVIEGVATRLKRHAEEDALCRTGDPEALEKLVAGYLHCP